MTTEDIVSSLQKFWSNNAPELIPTVFSGTDLDVSSQASWIEFWINQIEDLPKRQQSPLGYEMTIDIHFFSRDPDKRSVSGLVDDSRALLSATSIPVFSASIESTQVGQLRCREPVIRDFTRAESKGNRQRVQHLVLSLRGSALGQTN